MRIVIAGGGDVGYHLSSLLVKENHDIILIDKDKSILDYAESHLDVLTIHGDSSSIKIIQETEIENVDLFLSVTTSEKNNLLTTILAKKLGAKKTIARVDNPEYLVENQTEHFKSLGVDKVISIFEIAALEIKQLLKRNVFSDIFEFEKGKISLIGFILDNKSPLVNKKLKEIKLPDNDLKFRFVAILRGEKTIIPKGEDKILVGDHLYLITTSNLLEKITKFLGKTFCKTKNIMFLGGTPLSLRTASLIENNYDVKIIERNKKICEDFVEKLDKTLIINGNPNDLELLQEEDLGNMDVVIALTSNSEMNIITSFISKKHGAKKSIALVNNSNYIHLSQNLGVDSIINKKIIAANSIFKFVKSGSAQSITSINGVNGEIVEFIIEKNSNITGKPISEIDFPNKALIIGAIRGEKAYIPDGNFQLRLNDKVIVFSDPNTTKNIYKFFK